MPIGDPLGTGCRSFLAFKLTGCMRFFMQAVKLCPFQGSPVFGLFCFELLDLQGCADPGLPGASTLGFTHDQSTSPSSIQDWNRPQSCTLSRSVFSSTFMESARWLVGQARMVSAASACSACMRLM